MNDEKTEKRGKKRNITKLNWEEGEKDWKFFNLRRRVCVCEQRNIYVEVNKGRKNGMNRGTNMIAQATQIGE